MKGSIVFSMMMTILCTSCSIYRGSFDSCPGRGVPCVSVSELEKMIIETEEGPDIFVGHHLGCDTPLCSSEEGSSRHSSSVRDMRDMRNAHHVRDVRRIWFNQETLSDDVVMGPL